MGGKGEEQIVCRLSPPPRCALCSSAWKFRANISASVGKAASLGDATHSEYMCFASLGEAKYFAPVSLGEANFHAAETIGYIEQDREVRGVWRFFFVRRD